MNRLNLKGVTPAVWARTIAFLLSGINMIAVSFFDFQLLPYADEEIYTGVSAVVTFIFGLIATYKDTPLTIAAQKGNKVTKELKEEAKK